MPYDEFDDIGREPAIKQIFLAIGYLLGKHARVLAFSLTILVTAGLGYIFYNSYMTGSSSQEEIVPIIRADLQPFKVEPDDPGGMRIADRDSTVFGVLRTGNPDDNIENLLADDDIEEPLPRSQLFAGLNTEVDDSDVVTETIDTSAPSKIEEGQTALKTETPAKPAPETQAPAASETLTIAAIPEEKAPLEEVATPTVKSEEAPVRESITPKPPTAKPDFEKEKTLALVRQALKTEPAAGPVSGSVVKSGTHFVQLGSVSSRAGAEKEWTALKKKYPALGQLSHRVQEANLGAKGIFYRLQAGPLPKTDASTLCAGLKAAGKPGGCLVVGQ